MRIVVAMDSFKGSLTSLEAGNSVHDGIMKADPSACVTVCPMADGGEGTVEALRRGLGGDAVKVSVMGPLGASVDAVYCVLPDRRTAVMEMAAAAGITLVDPRKRDVRRATTYGVGQLILDAIARGCRHFILGIGGSATNDGGAGMLTALGYEFLDRNGQKIPPGCRWPGAAAQDLSRKCIAGAGRVYFPYCLRCDQSSLRQQWLQRCLRSAKGRNPGYDP